jgi:putative hydrolase of the HAD superfamily
MIQALIFDLDDTLYPERDFVISGYRAVARHIADSHAFSFDEIFSAMTVTLETLGRRKVFSALLVRFPGISIPLTQLIEVYREHSPSINLFPGYLELLKDLAARCRLGIITDGLPDIQARKVRALGIGSIMDKIIYSWEYGSERGKPHPLSFSLMLESLQTDPRSALFIGDNPEKDGRGAHGVGMRYAQIQHPPRAASTATAAAVAAEAQETPEFTINSIFQVPQILRHLDRNGN